MVDYLWYGIDAQGIAHQGSERRPSRACLVDHLAQLGIELKQCHRVWPWHKRWPKRLPKVLLLALLQQWSQLLTAGLPLLHCIRLSLPHKAPIRLRLALVTMENDLSVSYTHLTLPTTPYV